MQRTLATTQSGDRQGQQHDVDAGTSNSDTTTTTTTTTTTGTSSVAALPLPAPGSANRGDDVTQLPVGSSASLDALGPLVVNIDGSLGRVGNWAEMTPAEREGTLRLLRRRNPARLAAVREKQKQQQDNGGGAGEQK